MSVRRSCSFGDNPEADSPGWGGQDLLQDSVLGLGRAVLSQPGGGEARWTQLGLCTPIQQTRQGIKSVSWCHCDASVH